MGELRTFNLDVSTDELTELCRRYHVHELAIFGSVARGTAHDDSDVDLLVEFEADSQIGLIAFNRLADELSGLFRRHVDLVFKNGLKPIIRERVLKEAEVVFAA